VINVSAFVAESFGIYCYFAYFNDKNTVAWREKFAHVKNATGNNLAQ